MLKYLVTGLGYRKEGNFAQSGNIYVQRRMKDSVKIFLLRERIPI
jgi:hypothetical protein